MYHLTKNMAEQLNAAKLPQNSDLYMVAVYVKKILQIESVYAYRIAQRAFNYQSVLCWDEIDQTWEI